MLPTATTASLLTATGRSAIAVIAIDGPDATAVLDRLFQPLGGGSLAGRAVGRVIYGTWNAGEGVVARRCAIDRWEVHPHGGAAAVSAILADLTAAGCQAANWQTDLREQSDDSISWAASIGLSRAATERTAAHLLAQRGGALRCALETIVTQMEAQQVESALADMRLLLRSGRWGMHLTAPWKVMLCGSPNVGKSSLINALLGYGRAIVFDRPGTTRDVLTATTAINGWPVELSDTAGIRVSDEPLEAAGIARTRSALASADLVIPVLDRSRPLGDDDRRLLAVTGTNLVVANKADLPSRLETQGFTPPDTQIISTSAVTGSGIQSLLAAIARQLVPHEPATEEPALFSSDQVEIVTKAIEHSEQGDLATAIRVLRSI